MRLRPSALIAGIACCAGLVAIAGSVPAWLDDAITERNKANPANPIRFVDIKDSYVWYTMAATPETESKGIRGKIYEIAYSNGYANTQDEEMVTTAKPPSANAPAKAKKCWTRSFLRDVKQDSATTDERMLTTLVCEDGASWSVGFRAIQ